MEAPKYQQPLLDPAFMSLMEKTKQQDIDAARAGVARDTASLTARYGALTSGDSAGLLAKYSAQLALAYPGNAGNFSALLKQAG